MIRYPKHIILLAISFFIFYLLCLPQSVTLEDDGLFLLSSFFNGVSHPPGYPIHTLLGYVVTHLPIGNPALNGHALSALFASLGAALVFLITSLITTIEEKNILTPYIASFAYAFSTGVWSQSIITEVYTLNAFLFLCVLYLIVILKISLVKENNIKNKNKIIVFLLSLFTGLALANHWPLFVLGSIGLIYILFPTKNYLLQHWYIIISGLAIGLSPYLWLLVNSNSDTIIKFLGPIESWKDLYHYIARTNYNISLEFRTTATISDKLLFSIFTLKQLITQWGWLNILFVPIGFILFLKSKEVSTKTIRIGMLISYLSSSLLLVLILGYNYTLRNQINIQPFLVLAHSIGAILFAFGVVSVIEFIQGKTRIKLTLVLIPLILLQIFVANGFKNYRSNYNWADLYAKQVLDSLAPNSILIVSGDEGTGPIGYWHLISKYRPDITLIQEGGEVINHNRLFDPRKIDLQGRRKTIIDFVEVSTRPVYFNNNFIKINSTGHWLTYRYNKNIPDGQVQLQPLKDSEKKFLDYVFSDIHHTDLWTIQHIKHLRKRAIGHLIIEVETAKNEHDRLKYINYISKVTNDLNDITHTLSLLSLLNKAYYLDSEEKIIQKGWSLFKNEFDREYKSNFLNLLAELSFKSGDYIKSLDYVNQSINIWPTDDNKAYKTLNLLKQIKMPADRVNK